MTKEEFKELVMKNFTLMTPKEYKGKKSLAAVKANAAVEAHAEQLGAQLIDGEWYAPLWGCDTIQQILDEFGGE